MIVMVIVTPGSAPPMTPASVPKKSGTRYLTCATCGMAWARSSNTLKIRPTPARQQHREVAFEDVIRNDRGAEGHQPDPHPLARAARRRHRRIGGSDVKERGEAKAERRQRDRVDGEEDEMQRYASVIERGRGRQCGVLSGAQF